MNVKEFMRGISQIGFATSLHSLCYPWRRNRLDARFIRAAGRRGAERATEPGALLSAEPVSGGAVFHFESATMSARFLAPDVLFLAWNDAAQLPSFAVEPDGDPGTRLPGAAARLSRGDDGWRLAAEPAAEAFELRVSRDGTLRCFAGRGALLREEQPPVRQGSGWSQVARLEPGEAVYGLGSRAAPLDRRRLFTEAGALRSSTAAPVVYRFWNQDPAGAHTAGTDPLYICMPVYLCVRDAGAVLVFHDNTFDGQCAIGDNLEVRFSDGPCRTYLVAGTPASVLERFTGLTGRPPLPPRWALGYHHSRWGFGSQAETDRVRRGFRERGLPLGVLHADIDHMRGFRTLTTDGKKFPDLGALARALEESGARLVAIVDPGVKRDRKFPLYAEGLARGAFCTAPDGRAFHGVVWPGLAAFTDYTSPAARAWWGRQYEGELSRGVAGFWHDMNEPACFSSAGSATLPLSVRHDMEGKGGDHREAHNVYGMLMNRAGFEGLRALRPERRPFIVSRSGWVGMQRWSWSWTGDVETSWLALRATPAMVLGLSLCGEPYTGPDIGGFTGAPSAELYARWFELGSFLPFFRTHCSVHLPDREPWCFGPEVLAVARKHMELRVSLLPFWYTLAWRASRSGLPLARPLLWADPGNPALRAVDDAFLLGDELLVAPVLAEAGREKPVRLPPGLWYEMEGGTLRGGASARATARMGGSEVTLPAPLDVVPLLARAGSIVPVAEGDRLFLHAFAPGGSGARECRGLLYDDAGDGYGPSRVDSLTLACTSGDSRPSTIELSWSVEGEFPWRWQSVTLVPHGFDGARFGVAGAPVAVAVVQAAE